MFNHAGENLFDIVRMEEAAALAGRSAEALLGYVSRLDALRAPKAGLSHEALAERAANAELHMRIVLSAGLDAVNELHDLGFYDHSMRSVAGDLDAFNQATLPEALGQIAKAFQERLPAQRWDWLEKAGELVKGVEWKLGSDATGLSCVISQNGHPTHVRLTVDKVPKRVSIGTFFSAGPNRVYVPVASAAAMVSSDYSHEPLAPYLAMIDGMAFAREWVYRHARNAAELGPPARAGGGPVAVVIAIVLVVIAAVATVAAAILGFACLAGSDTSCRWAAYLGIIGAFLTGGAKTIDSQTGQTTTISYGTNTQ